MPDVDRRDWDVAIPYTETVVVQDSDLDQFGHANNVTYLAWLEQVAWGHSRSLGLGMDEYRRLGCGCVVRRHEIEYLLPAFAGDTLLLGTWVEENDGRLSMWRGYQIVREGDGKTLLRARTRWVCIDLVSGKPRRMPPEFVIGYQPSLAKVSISP